MRWVFAVPQIWRITAGEISARPVSNHPLLEDEQEAITWTAYDRQDGVDYGRVAYARRPNGEPVFAEPQVLTVGVHPGETTPGYRLLRALPGFDTFERFPWPTPTGRPATPVGRSRLGQSFRHVSAPR